MTADSKPLRCLRCQHPFPRGHAAGNCAACLLKTALAADSDEVVEGEWSDVLPQELGDFAILGEIGRGGTGVVYRARQRSVNRIVALKTLHGAALTRRAAFQRLRIEAEAVGRLEHPHIVPLYEVGCHAGTHFLTLRYFEHGSLADLLERRRLSPQESAELIRTAARAVHHAHQRGVLHRDLKPSNLLLDAQGLPHVSDFGLAKLADGDSSLTLSQAVLGTPAYMAPEQASGDAKNVGALADVYSLGAVLYELLTGRPPFTGATALEILRQVADDEPVRPRSLNATLDRDLEAICLHCLEKEPDRRYASAGALADDLERWLRHESTTVRPTSWRGRTARWIRRRPIAAALAVAVPVAVAEAVVLWLRPSVPAASKEPLFAAHTLVPLPRRPVAPVIADVDRDGRPDLVVALAADNAVAVLLGQPTGNFLPAAGSPFPVGSDPIHVEVADLDGDLRPDLAVASGHSNSLTLLRGDGTGSLHPVGNSVPVGRNPRTVRVTDFDGDGRSDLVVANFEGESLAVLRGDGAWGFTAGRASPLAVGRNPWGLVVADLDRDGSPDLAVASESGHTLDVLKGDGQGGFARTPGSPLKVGAHPFDVTTADVNGDAKPDLISANTYDHTLTVLLGNGQGGFHEAPGSPLSVGGQHPRQVVSADFDGDGRADLAVANEGHSVSVLLGDGTGRFTHAPGTPLLLPGMISTLAVGDLNGDRAVDLVAALTDLGLSISLNRSPKSR
jgi:tRNA A-37 threonylcarbamoyl transferase component Bud32